MVEKERRDRCLTLLNLRWIAFFKQPIAASATADLSDDDL
jgi:hypothetical protein